MPNKKLLIQIVIIAACFIGAAVVLYNGLKGSGASVLDQTAIKPVSPSNTGDKILPNGDTLDFNKALYEDRFQYDQINYPKLDPKNEVGIPENSLVVPPSGQ